MTRRAYLPENWDLIRLQSAVADVLPSAVAVLSREYKLQWANEAFWTMIGGPQRMSDNDFLGIVPYPANEEIERALAHVKATGESFRDADLQVHCPLDDAEHFLDITIMPLDVDGQPPALMFLASDVTQQSEFRRSLEEVAAEADRERHQLDLLMRNAPVGVAFYSPDMRITRINPFLAHMSFREPQDMVGRRLADLLPSLAGQVEPMLQRVMCQGITLNEVEVSGDVPGEPGHVRTWIGTLFPVRQADGAIIGAGAAVLEITEHKKDELLKQRLLEAVKSSRDTLRSLIETIPAGVIVAGADGTFTLVNQKAGQWLRGTDLGDAFTPAASYTLHNLDGSPIPGDDLPLAKALRKQTVTDNVDILARFADGGEMIVQCSARPILDAMGTTTAAVVVFLDVTERRRSRQRLTELAAGLQALIEASPLPVIAMDLAGNVVRWCPSSERIFGWKREEVLGKPAPNIAPEYRQEAERVQDEILNRGQDLVIRKVRRQTKDGQQIELTAWISPVKDEQGTITGTIGVYAPVGPTW